MRVWQQDNCSLVRAGLEWDQRGVQRSTNLIHQGERIFKFVHHVRILVHDADAMVQYMAQTFAMTPVKVQVYESRGMKNAIYQVGETNLDRKSTRLNSSHLGISYAVFCL